MQDLKIEFVYPHSPTVGFLRRVLFTLTAEGARYNVGEYPGEYLIIPKNHSNQVKEKEGSGGNCAEKLEEIAENYSKFDSSTTTVSISLNYFDREFEIPFTLQLDPTSENQLRVSFWISGRDVETRHHFQSFVDLCTVVFERFDFTFGKARTEYEEPIPTSKEKISQEPLGLVTFYSKNLAESMEVERLRLAHVYRFARLENDEVAIILTSGPESVNDQTEGRNRIETANKILGMGS